MLAPHGVYPAAGDDRWVAIAVTDDDAWRALCGELDRADLAGAVAPRTAGARRRELDDVLAAWTAARAADETMDAPPAASAWPPTRCRTPSEAFADPQLRHRGHFVEVPHSAMGTTWVEGSRLRFSRTPVGRRTGRARRSASTAGRC